MDIVFDMRFLLINPKNKLYLSRGEEPDDQILDLLLPPLGLLYTASCLENNGHSVEIIDLNFEKKPIELILKKIFNSDVVGLNIYTNYDYKEINHLLFKIKDIDSNIIIIIGGPHCTFQPKKSLQDIPLADFSIEGESELILPRLVKQLEEGTESYSIPGVNYRTKKGVVKGNPAKIIMNLDDLCFPSRHLIKKYNYGLRINGVYYKDKMTSISTSRGCPFHCRFCPTNVRTIKSYRRRSVDDVVDEFIQINQDYSSVVIVDDCFLVSNKRSHELFDKLIKNNIDLELIVMGTRIDFADRVLYKKMKKAGVSFIFYGIESGNQDVLNYYRKGITVDQIKETIQLANKMNIRTIGSFIFGAPFETKKHIEKTISFAKKLPLDFAMFNILSYTYRSDLWFEAVESGKISADDRYLVVANNDQRLSLLTTQELFNYCEKAYKNFYVNPSYLFNQLQKSLKQRDYFLLRLLLHTVISKTKDKIQVI